MAVSQVHTQFYQQHERYWDQGEFHNIYTRIQAIQNTAVTKREEITSTLSELLKLRNKGQFEQEKRASWKLFKQNVVALQNIEREDLGPVVRLLEDSALERSIGSGDFESVDLRLQKLQEDVRAVYKNALYPWLLALQNGDKDWDPTGIVCRVWDYFSWKGAGDVRGEIEKKLHSILG